MRRREEGFEEIKRSFCLFNLTEDDVLKKERMNEKKEKKKKRNNEK